MLGTVEQVRDSIGGEFSDATIKRSLIAARVIVEYEADVDDTDLLREAVIAVAAKKTFSGAPQTTRKSAANVTKELSVDGDGLDDAAEAALRRVRNPELFETA